MRKLKDMEKFKANKIIVFVFIASLAGLFIFAGCGNFFSGRTTEIETQKIFRDLSRVNIDPDVNQPLPKHYTEPPKVLKTKNGFKLFYFTRQHDPKTLSGMIKQQFKLTISENPATNQLVIQCANQEQVDSVLEFLDSTDVQPVQVKIDCMVSELFADLTMDYETQTEITELLGEEVTLDTILPGASIRSPERKNEIFGIFGYDNMKDFKATLDLLESRGYAKILLNPSLEVVNGRTAKIETVDRVPIEETIILSSTEKTTFRFEKVRDYLEVTPQVYADGTIGLKTKAGISSRTIPEGVSQAPIITERTIENDENRLRKGESLVVGGIIKNNRVSVVRGIPFLKDIPLLGILFSSKDFEDSSKEILFILTPRISTNGKSYTETVEYINEKHNKPEYEGGIQDMVTDPLGIGAYKSEMEEEAAEAELQRLKAEIEKAEALKEVEKVKEKLMKTAEEAVKEKTKAQQAMTEAQKAKQEAQKAKQQAKQAQDEAAKAKQEAQKALTDAQKEKQKAQEALKKAQQEKQKAEEKSENQQSEQKSQKAEPEQNKKQVQQGKNQQSDQASNKENAQDSQEKKASSDSNNK